MKEFRGYRGRLLRLGVLFAKNGSQVVSPFKLFVERMVGIFCTCFTRGSEKFKAGGTDIGAQACEHLMKPDVRTCS